MVRTLTILSLLLLVAAVPCRGEAMGEIRPSSIVSLTGGTTTVAVDIDLGTSASSLGSYGAVLSWDPASLQYVSDTGGGEPPFESAVVNRSEVGGGVLRFSDASATGAGDLVNLLNVTFMAIAAPPLTTVLDLEFTSAFAADFEDLAPELQIQDGSTCIADYFFDLRADGPDTILIWNAISDAVRYDVVRGDLSQLSDYGSAVGLGVVACIENDSVDTTTGAGTEPANPDTEIPAESEGFFYLVRFDDLGGPGSYGFPLACSQERIADAGDCP